MANIRVGSVAVYLEIMMRNFRFRRTSRINLTENDGLPFSNRHGLPKRDERTAKFRPSCGIAGQDGCRRGVCEAGRILHCPLAWAGALDED
jgi:hypothetical protein